MNRLPFPRKFQQTIILLAVALLGIATPVVAGGPAVPATPPNYVVDLAGVIDDGVEARTNALLRELEQQTTAQVVVLTLPSLEGESLEAFSIDLAHNRWKLGQKGKDNGVLLTLALQERKYRIEVGFGLESVLPDSLVGSLGRTVLVPAFRAGDFGGGIAAMARELATRVAATSGVALSSSPPVAVQQAAQSERAQGKPGPLNIVMMLLAGAIFLYLLIRHPQLLNSIFRQRQPPETPKGGCMDYNRNKKYFEPANLKPAIIAIVIGVVIFLGGVSSKGGGGGAVVGLVIAGIGGFLFSKAAGGQSDSEIDQACAEQCKDLKARALKKIGLDEDQVTEAAPIQFQGYFFKSINTPTLFKLGKDKIPRTSNFKAVMFFFSAEQVYCYEYTFSIVADEKRESTEEYFYRDIVAASTASESTTFTVKGGKQETVNYEYFKLTTSGGTFIQAAMDKSDTTERSINAMKSLLRNKKQQLKS